MRTCVLTHLMWFIYNLSSKEAKTWLLTTGLHAVKNCEIILIQHNWTAFFIQSMPQMEETAVWRLPDRLHVQCATTWDSWKELFANTLWQVPGQHMAMFSVVIYSVYAYKYPIISICSYMLRFWPTFKKGQVGVEKKTNNRFLPAAGLWRRPVPGSVRLLAWRRLCSVGSPSFPQEVGDCGDRALIIHTTVSGRSNEHQHLRLTQVTQT